MQFKRLGFGRRLIPFAANFAGGSQSPRTPRQLHVTRRTFGSPGRKYAAKRRERHPRPAGCNRISRSVQLRVHRSTVLRGADSATHLARGGTDTRSASLPRWRHAEFGAGAGAGDGRWGRDMGCVTAWARPAIQGARQGADEGRAVRGVLPRSVAGQMIPLRYGVTIALCEDHRDPAFVRSRGGRDFLAAMTTTYESLGLRGARYRKAIQAFVADVLAMGTPTPRHRPGSYAWPEQRRDAEAVWAGGGGYHDGEAAVLAYFTRPVPGMRAPSGHTIRRWWRERRWLTPRPSPPRRRPAPGLHDRRPITRLDRAQRHPQLAASGISRPELQPPRRR